MVAAHPSWGGIDPYRILPPLRRKRAIFKLQIGCTSQRLRGLSG
jgi:hypothetical protein